MTKAEFEAKLAELRELLATASELGDIAEITNYTNKVEELQNTWHEQCVAAANDSALSGEAASADPMKNAAVSVMAAKTVEKMEEKTMNRTDLIASESYRNAFLAHMQGKTVDAEGMQNLVTAGAAIPTVTVNKIYDFIKEDPLLSRITLLHIPGNVTLPVDSTNADAAWVAMGTSQAASADALAPVSLAAYKLIKNVEIGADVAEMAIPEFESWLVQTLGTKIRRALAASVINGTGSNQPTGLVGLSAAGTYTKAGMTYKNLLTILASLDQDHAEGACLIMKRSTFYSDIAGMVDTTGAPVVVRDVQDPAKLRILDAEVILTQAVTDDAVYYGNPANFVMNIGGEISVKKDESVGFLTGSTTYRGMCLADGKVVAAAAFKKWTRATA